MGIVDDVVVELFVLVLVLVLDVFTVLEVFEVLVTFEVLEVFLVVEVFFDVVIAAVCLASVAVQSTERIRKKSVRTRCVKFLIISRSVLFNYIVFVVVVVR